MACDLGTSAAETHPPNRFSNLFGLALVWYPLRPNHCDIHRPMVFFAYSTHPGSDERTLEARAGTILPFAIDSPHFGRILTKQTFTLATW